ncbi:glycosyl transferase [Pediococcus damnosus LMG 28219]|uniref:beta 1-4 rhamnosyltransferase Cps2T n=1 Tax=Pediococcus damnosus TaxID=51663 RepID=UPI00061EAB1D|nr:DUF1972 domain-containing protein [Pediococcus damnosus]KJU73433.1 glycosyl transferase [Pediococcus damnosus LMG 28219]PIO86014.1 glycosyl transferase [Pediococcus damnosus]
MKKHVFIVGSKGIPANYGGYETFVEYLTKYRKDTDIHYHVACKSKNKSQNHCHFVHNNADCFNIYVPNIGPGQAIYYDVAALNYSIEYAKVHHILKPIFYILACRIGPFMSSIVKRVHAINGKVYVNPDGHEWMRAKWSVPVRKYWKLSERLMVKHADLLICDSKNIEKYIKSVYKNYKPKTIFIAYGSDVKKSELTDENPKVKKWLKKFNIKRKEYYLIVGRFVPENNYETMIQEFMHSTTKKDLIIITNVEHNKFFETLKSHTHFESDERIKFVGTVYDAELLKKVRELAFAYIHGHSVGGTNPSLLEALASTDINLLYDVGFNREVAQDGALYWGLKKNELSGLINSVDKLNGARTNELANNAKLQIKNRYSWQTVIEAYEEYFKGI